MPDIVWVDHGWKQILERVERLGRVEVKVGVVGEKALEQYVETPLTVGEVAIINELGTTDGHIPARRFVERTMQENEGGVARHLANVARNVTEGGSEPLGVLNDVGAWAAERVRETVRAGVPPPNAPSTLAKKDGTTPLIDTGALLDAIGHEVTHKEAEGEYEEVEIGGVAELAGAV